jgi:hypothetical protein
MTSKAAHILEKLGTPYYVYKYSGNPDVKGDIRKLQAAHGPGFVFDKSYPEAGALTRKQIKDLYLHELRSGKYDKMVVDTSKGIGRFMQGEINEATRLGIPIIKTGEYAPGIPSKSIKDLPRISEPQTMRLAIQRHEANKAGGHYDLRIVDDKSGKAYSWAVKNLPALPGDKTLAVLQPTHTANYATWSGKIESGYGAGEVSLFQHDKIEVLKAEPSKITFNVYKSNGDTERFAMINTGGDDWLFHNVTPTRTTRPEVPSEKPHYKSIAPSNLDPTNPNQIWAPKVDGALNVFVLRTGKPIETYSYRPSAKGPSKLIDHTYRMPLHHTKVPDAFKGKTVVLGEVFAKDRASGKALPTADTSARLLSNVWRSRELQQNSPLDNMVFNVLRYNGRDVSNKPYSEKLEMLKHITSAIPQLKMPPLHETPESKQQLLNEISSKQHALSEEGVVVYDMNASVPLKAKFQQDYDVYIRGTFPGEGKYKDNAAGGFTYSHSPEGKVIGRVGSGFSDEMRKQMHEQPSKFIGGTARVFAQQQLPSGALRVPVFKDIRIEKFAASGQAFHTSARLLKRQDVDIPASAVDHIAALIREGKISAKDLEIDGMVVDLAYNEATKKVLTARPTAHKLLSEIARFKPLKKLAYPNVQEIGGGVDITLSDTRKLQGENQDTMVEKLMDYEDRPTAESKSGPFDLTKQYFAERDMKNTRIRALARAGYGRSNMKED